MGSYPRLIFLLLWIVSFVTATPLPRALTGYAPVPAACPAEPLVRPATGISYSELCYIRERYWRATRNLRTWLKQTDPSFHAWKYPVVALTTSGGGHRSLLTGAGVIQGFDLREGLTGVSGVYQGLTYEAGLSGGSWLLSSLAGNNYPTISNLKTGLWEPMLQTSLLVPSLLLAATPVYDAISNDLEAKEAAGFPPTLTDPWGRILSYQLLYGPDGGVMDTLSGIVNLSNFTCHNVPYPIITSLGVNTFQGQCLPMVNATQYEFHPYEFGSWDTGVSAFTKTAYLGSSLVNGSPATSTCIQNYDNLGYVLGTSSSLFNALCAPAPAVNTTNNTFIGLVEDLAALVAETHPVTTRENYAAYPNPFYQYPRSSLVSAQKELDLVDGGEALQNNPLWPLLHRQVDVAIVNDNSADTTTNYPNGTQIYVTYLQATAQGLTRMPTIPPPPLIVAQGLNIRPTFFGCNNPNKTTIIYIPNTNYTYNSGQPTAKLQYYIPETDAMIANGVQIASKGGDPQWPLCLACGIMKKSPGAQLPAGCADCYKQYCYN